LDKWSTAPTSQQILTGATPLADLKAGNLIISSKEEQTPDWQTKLNTDKDATIFVKPATIYNSLTFGRISGTMGVTSALLISIGGIYLFWNKTASRAIILSVIISYMLWNQILTWFGVPRFYGSIFPILSGGFLFGAFYMATDPVSSPKRTASRIIYGIIIGTSTMVIRNFSIFNGGLMFSILIGNMFAPILDYAVDAYTASKKTKITGEKS
jgi:Na+-transporting NADH:ubiquinone oxidoreductase subunit B